MLFYRNRTVTSTVDTCNFCSSRKRFVSHSDWSKYIFVANEYTANVIYCSPQLCIFIEPINTHFHVINKYSLNIRKETCFLFLYDLIIQIVKNHGRSGKLWAIKRILSTYNVCDLVSSTVRNLFIQSAAKCTCTNFILQISETFLCQSLGNHWKTFPQQQRENRWQ